MKTATILSRIFTILLMAGQMIFLNRAAAQNLVVNPGFSDGTNGWSTQCSIEINPETVYGGTNASNPVTEIDEERCLNQEISVASGATYDFSYKASRRQGGTPATVGVTVTITGVQSGITYANVNHTYTNTTWQYTAENFSFTVPVNTIDTRIDIKFSNYATTGTYGTLIDDISLTVNPLSSTLPVKLESFTGEIKNARAILSWTASNEDNDGRYFIIERAAGRGAFDSIGVVPVSGASYSFTDNRMLSGTNNYRLKIVNLAGSTYSKIISLDNERSSNVQVYPNPATTSIGFSLKSSERSTVSVKVYSLSGSIVTAKQQQLNTGFNIGSVDITSLHSGTFFLKISDDKGLNYVQEFCKR